MRSSLLILVTALAPLSAQAPAPAKDVKALRAFFAAECARCHGADGSAIGPDGKPLKGVAFTNPVSLAGRSDEKLAKVILKGIFFGKAMPAFKDKLTEAEAQTMVREVLRKATKGQPIQP
jgi:mono/diheme cytochrome c family protein